MVAIHYSISLRDKFKWLFFWSEYFFTPFQGGAQSESESANLSCARTTRCRTFGPAAGGAAHRLTVPQKLAENLKALASEALEAS
jgi:hypothetical protein